VNADKRDADDVIAGYLRNNEVYARHHHERLPIRPAKHTAVVACMDSRMDIFQLLGLNEGDAHVIRNAGGVVTDDVIRSLLISQRLLGTRQIVLIHHTDCGMLTFRDDEFRAEIEAETGAAMTYPLHAFEDLDADVRAGTARIKADPHLLHRDVVCGFVFDVATGRLREVEPA